MPLFHALLLGAIQGLTEFFPVSSSGHLILLPVFFHWKDQGKAFDTVLHLGTLAALLWYFWGDLAALARHSIASGPSAVQARTFLIRVFVATLPALVIGYALRHVIDALTRHAWLVAIDSVVWGLVLLAADRFAKKRHQESSGHVPNVSWKQALAVGCAQPIALLPGSSRSGMTITAGLLTGLSREDAARFSFFLSIPVTAAAGGYGLLTTIHHGIGGDGMMSLFVGFITAAIVGAYAIRFLISYVSKKPFDVFVAYRVALAALVWLLV